MLPLAEEGNDVAMAAERLATFPPEERARRLELLRVFEEFVAAKPLPALQRAREVLEHAPGDAPPPDVAADAALREARARNLARVFEGRARLAAESVSAAAVQRGLGMSRQRLHQLVRAGRLLAVLPQDRKAGLYPAWQFAGDGTPLSGLSVVLAAAREAEMDPETVHFTMTAPNDRIGGRTLADLLAEGRGDEAARLLRAAGLGPF